MMTLFSVASVCHGHEGGLADRETDSQRPRDRQTERQTGRQIDQQTDRLTDRLKHTISSSETRRERWIVHVHKH